MSIYKSSTLAMIPTAYKDGKLYSVRPTDGSGDFTFSRGSNLAATRVSSSGYIEKGRENLSLYSNTFSSWTAASGGSVTSGQSGYDGTNDAWLLTSGAATYSRIERTISHTGLYTISVYAKAGTLGWLSFENSGISSDESYFDLTTGTLGSLGANVITANIESIGSGWYRCSATLNGTSATQRIYPAVANGDLNSAQGNIYIQDFQLEQGLVATDYIETTTTSVSAGILEDMPRLDYSSGSCPSLLLEPQRSNLVPFSEHLESSDWAKTRCTIEDNSTTSPEGVVNASKMTSTDASESYIQDNLATTGTKVTWSFFAKKGDLDYAHGLVWDLSANGCRQWFNLSTGAVGGTTTFGSGYSVDSATIEDYGNGWYRCAMVVNSTAGTQGCRVNISSADTAIGSAVNSYGYFYGIQLEDASYPTSYIPTYGSAVTRNQDNNTASFADIEPEGTLFAEVEVVDTGAFGTPMALSINDATSDFILVYKSNINKLSARIRLGSVDQCLIDSGTLTEGYHKFAFRYRENDCEFFVDGVSVGTDTSVSIPTGLNTIRQYIGSSINPFIGGTKQLLYFPTALTDSECIALTTL